MKKRKIRAAIYTLGQFVLHTKKSGLNSQRVLKSSLCSALQATCPGTGCILLEGEPFSNSHESTFGWVVCLKTFALQGSCDHKEQNTPHHTTLPAHNRSFLNIAMVATQSEKSFHFILQYTLDINYHQSESEATAEHLERSLFNSCEMHRPM